MMTTYIFLLILCLVIIALPFVFRNTTFVKKYWRYSLVLIPAIVIITLKILVIIRQKNPSSTPDSNPVKDEIINIKEKLQEVNTVVKIEAAVAKENNDQKMQQLKEVQKIPDDRERRKKLAEMIG